MTVVWQTVGHDAAVRALSRAMEQGRMHHALLLVGPPRVGKMALAMDVARALNCLGEEPSGGPCRQCERISDSLHPDVRVIGVEEDDQGRARTLISIEQVRVVQKEASLRPYEGAFRVFIIDGVDRMSDEAANSLLKTLEEPPDQVVLVLLASDASSVLPTIRSRCRRLDLRPVGVDTIADHLVTTLEVDSALAQEVARLSGGRIGWAVQAAQVDLNRLEVLGGIGERMSDAANELAAAVAQAEGFGIDAESFRAEYDNANAALDLAQIALETAADPAAQTAAQAVLDAAQAQADAAADALAEVQAEAVVAAAGVTVAEAEGALAAAEAAVFEAQIPLELFAAEIAVGEAEADLAAKEGGLVALEAAAAVPAL